MASIIDLSDKPALIAALVRNGMSRTSCVMESQPGGIVETIGGVQYANSTINSRTLNSAQGGNYENETDLAAIRKVKDYFDSRKLKFSLWVPPPSSVSSVAIQNLQDIGYILTDEVCTGMAALLSNTVATTSPYPPPTNISVSPATTEERMRDFGDVINTCFPPPPYPDYCDFAEYNASLARHADLSTSSYKRFVGYVDGKPVATGGVMIADGVAGIYDIATRPEAQRRGYAAVMMKTVLDEARKCGCTLTVLEASEDGKGVYEKLGFVEAGTWTIWHNP